VSTNSISDKCLVWMSSAPEVIRRGTLLIRRLSGGGVKCYIVLGEPIRLPLPFIVSPSLTCHVIQVKVFDCSQGRVVLWRGDGCYWQPGPLPPVDPEQLEKLFGVVFLVDSPTPVET
jgi:hypothetical protein